MRCLLLACLLVFPVATEAIAADAVTAWFTDARIDNSTQSPKPENTPLSPYARPREFSAGIRSAKDATLGTTGAKARGDGVRLRPRDIR